jgi:hypothetical protein
MEDERGPGAGTGVEGGRVMGFIFALLEPAFFVAPVMLAVVVVVWLVLGAVVGSVWAWRRLARPVAVPVPASAADTSLARFALLLARILVCLIAVVALGIAVVYDASNVQVLQQAAIAIGAVSAHAAVQAAIVLTVVFFILAGRYAIRRRTLDARTVAAFATATVVCSSVFAVAVATGLYASLFVPPGL